MEIKNRKDYKEGDSVVCVINSRATLTVGKIYVVEKIFFSKIYPDHPTHLYLKNDKGFLESYDNIRFIPLKTFRKKILDQIIN